MDDFMQKLDPGIAPSRLKAYITRELDVKIPSVQWKGGNVNIN